MSPTFFLIVLIVVLLGESGHMMKKSQKSRFSEDPRRYSYPANQRPPHPPLHFSPSPSEEANFSSIPNEWISGRRLARRAVVAREGLVLRIGVLAPGNYDFQYSLQKILPAITMATKSERIERILPHWKIEVIYRDTKCSSTLGPLEAFQFYTNKTAGLNSIRVKNT